MPEDNSIKIFFRFYSDILDEETSETLLAEVFESEYGYYKLLGIPFYAAKIAAGDIVWAEYNDTEGMLTYRKTVQHSGSSTIHVIILAEGQDINKIRGIFEESGCKSACLNHKYFALDVPVEVDYFLIKIKLDELEKNKIIDYAESCLSERHQYKNVFFR